MRALVVFESMFGNTRQIAGAVADGLSQAVRTDLVEVSRAPAQISGDVELVVVGGPTHAFGMTRPGTRRDAARQAAEPLVSAGTMTSPRPRCTRRSSDRLRQLRRRSRNPAEAGCHRRSRAAATRAGAARCCAAGRHGASGRRTSWSARSRAGANHGHACPAGTPMVTTPVVDRAPGAAMSSPGIGRATSWPAAPSLAGGLLAASS